MAKKVTAVIKLQIPAAQANPSPPVGPALGQHGVNIMEFVKTFNARTSGQGIDGTILPVLITVYQDRSFTFITKTPPAAILIKKVAQIAKGSPSCKAQKVGSITKTQLKEIAEKKFSDMNAADLEGAIRTIAGTARSMGVEIVEG